MCGAPVRYLLQIVDLPYDTIIYSCTAVVAVRVRSYSYSYSFVLQPCSRLLFLFILTAVGSYSLQSLQCTTGSSISKRSSYRRGTTSIQECSTGRTLLLDSTGTYLYGPLWLCGLSLFFKMTAAHPPQPKLQ
jgi:hypothetical protein